MHAQEVAQEVLAPQEVQNPIRKKTQEATSPNANRK